MVGQEMYTWGLEVESKVTGIVWSKTGDHIRYQVRNNLFSRLPIFCLILWSKGSQGQITEFLHLFFEKMIILVKQILYWRS